MNLTDLISYKPRGYKRYLTPQEYESSDDEHKYYYVADYLKYKNVKVREYSECQECGHKEFIGWVTIPKPIGKPYRYILTPRVCLTWIMKGQIENLNSSNILMDRVLNKRMNPSKPVWVETNGRSLVEALKDPTTEITK